MRHSQPQNRDSVLIVSFFQDAHHHSEANHYQPQNSMIPLDAEKSFDILAL